MAGDGTTTATVLAQAMVHEGMKNLEAGANPIVLRKGMKKATDNAVEAIRAMSSKVNGKEQIARVAAVSSGDEEVGQMVADAMEKEVIWHDLGSKEPMMEKMRKKSINLQNLSRIALLQRMFMFQAIVHTNQR